MSGPILAVQAVLDPTLARNIVFASHNLATDASFNEFNAVICRNVMLDFDRELQARVYDLLHQSLVRFGLLAIGRGESLRFNRHRPAYAPVSPSEKIYRRVA